MLSDRCLSVLSVLSVTLVHRGQTVGWINMKLDMVVGLGDFVLDGSSLPPKKGYSPPTPIFGPCLLWLTGGWITMPLGTEIGLGRGDIVLDGSKGFVVLRE